MHIRCALSVVACILLPAAANQTSSYVSMLTGHTYIFNSTLGDRYSAEAGCKAAGGQLASYQHLDEQVGPTAATGLQGATRCFNQTTRRCSLKELQSTRPCTHPNAITAQHSAQHSPSLPTPTADRGGEPVYQLWRAHPKLSPALLDRPLHPKP